VQRATSSLIPGLITFVVGLALAGFLLGDHGGSSTVTAAKPQIAAGAGTLLEYPASWRPASGAPSIPGLTIADALVLAPGGHAASAGLLSGRLPAGSAGPLPVGFVSLVHGLPRTEVVDLANEQAYRYREVHLEGYGRALQLYVIPSTVEGPTALACYASVESSPFMRQCEQIVAQIAVPAQSLYSLSPSGSYAAQLGKPLGVLERQRLALREGMHARNAPGVAAGLASALAQRFAETAAAIRTLEPPQSASSAQVALTGSLQSTRGAYRALAAALTGGSPTEAQNARAKVSSAEAEVDTALETYALLGYAGV
jgi:hypothetical protein